jgi:hypothetical protein
MEPTTVSGAGDAVPGDVVRLEELSSSSTCFLLGMFTWL